MTESTKGMTAEEAIRGLTERMKDLFARNYGHSRSDYGMNTESLWPLGEDVLKVCADYEADILSLLKTDRTALAKQLAERVERYKQKRTQTEFKPNRECQYWYYDGIIDGLLEAKQKLESKSEMRQER